MQLNHKQLEETMKQFINGRMALFIHGAPGIGKSDAVRKVAKETANNNKLLYTEDITDVNKEGKFLLIDIRISQLDPTDLRGLPHIDNSVTKWVVPDWLPRKGNGILFFDELNLAPPSIQAACYQLILDKRLGDYILPKGYSIIAAGNRLEDKANIFEMAAPLRNRFCHVELAVPTVDDWVDWALKNDVDGRIIAFIKWREPMLYKFDAKSSAHSFPTPRSWFFLSRLIRGVEDLGMVRILASSAVGDGTSIEFEAFTKLSRKFDLDELLSDPEKVKGVKEIDMKFAVVGGVSEKYRSNRKVLRSVLGLCEYLDPEYAILLLRMIRAIDEEKFVQNLVREKKWEKLSAKYAKYLQ